MRSCFAPQSQISIFYKSVNRRFRQDYVRTFFKLWYSFTCCRWTPLLKNNCQSVEVNLFDDYKHLTMTKMQKYQNSVRGNIHYTPLYLQGKISHKQLSYLCDLAAFPHFTQQYNTCPVHQTVTIVEYKLCISLIHRLSNTKYYANTTETTIRFFFPGQLRKNYLF